MIKLEDGARRVVVECGQATAGETVLVITDPRRPAAVAAALEAAAQEVGAHGQTLTMAADGPPGGEPPDTVAMAMQQADLVVFATTRIMFHARATAAARASGCRVISLTGCVEATLTEGGIEADFAGRAPVCDAVCDRISAASEVVVRTQAGTRLQLSVAGRVAVPNYGMCRGSGTASGVPDIEAYVAPVEGTADGVIVVDDSTACFGLVDSPIVIDVGCGRVERIRGGQHAERLAALLERLDDPRAMVLAECAIGLNPKAHVTGTIIEDEGCYGTGHFALGDNSHFGGHTEASLHLDMVYWRPSIWLDGEVLMEEGVLTMATAPAGRAGTPGDPTPA